MTEFTVHGKCRTESVVKGDQYRFTVLTSRLVRLEYFPNGKFEDRPSVFAVNRDFETPRYSVIEGDIYLEVHTDDLSIYYDRGPFSPGGLFVKVRSECRGIYSTWHYLDPLLENLGGTARTLDQADGEIPLQAGIQSRLQGYSVIDDSHSMVFQDNNWVEPRAEGTIDLYFFGYGLAYQEALSDYFCLSGKTPLIPRYALGNWWSRFYPYSEEEYMSLMERFRTEMIPLSIAVIDMDWHITDVEPKYGKGWTGYTWNEKLIPNPSGFLEKLHSQGLKVTLNLHPAEGIQPHEKQYANACVALKRDPKDQYVIPFDFCDPEFVSTYFNVLLEPLEKDGVDFWWIDWQQGSEARYPGADPLWLLNHFHFLHSASGEMRPFIFSRYAGPGSHRYPIGFSGDSVISWKSLQFQPYFTATAANIGYGWWSHDIGGHCAGERDDELMVRWVQFGVFSPIMRLHSTSNLFNGKEPWKYSKHSCEILKDYLRLRHQFIPYLYTQNWKAKEEDILLVRPMYYHYPKQEEAYEVPNQYEFGDQLMVCPITMPTIPVTRMGKTTGWLPEGSYYDFFTGMRYRGNCKQVFYRSLEEIPVFAKAGAIIPLTERKEALQNGTKEPEAMELRVFGGANGYFSLYEDDGLSERYQKGEVAFTEYDFQWNQQGTSSLVITPDDDVYRVRPAQRQYQIEWIGVRDCEEIVVHIENERTEYTKWYDSDRNILTVMLPKTGSEKKIVVEFTKGLILADNNMEKRIFERIHNFRIGYEQKERIYQCITSKSDRNGILSELYAMDLDQDIMGAILEVLLAG